MKQAAPKKEKPVMISKATIIKEYGWTESLIKKYLPEPVFRPNPHYSTAPKMRLWPAALVEATMQKATFQKDFAKIQEKRDKAQREKKQEAERIHRLLLKNDLPAMLEKAKHMDRHFVLHCGPTNSGKTYQSLEALKHAKTGVYLGPLRLLALEVFDTLNSDGVPCNLLTGEEATMVPFAEVTASTIEMLDTHAHYDVAVIDEAQLIADKDRGGAWTKALLCVDAKEVHVCFAPEALRFIEGIIKDIGASYELVNHERLTPLVYSGNVKGLGSVEPGDAFIAFSRKTVLQIAALLEKKHNVKASVIYGALPPDSRRREVHRFEAGETTVVVATDAIGMGVSLPIRRIIFCNTQKYDGIQRRGLTTAEINQIAGRAGRYGKFDCGEVLVSGKSKLFKKRLGIPASPISKVVVPFPKEITQEDCGVPLKGLLLAWQALPDMKQFVYEDMGNAIRLLEILEAEPTIKSRLKATPTSKIYEYITCPVDANKYELIQYWLNCCKALLFHGSLPKPNAGMGSLEACEIRYKQLDILHQMGRRAGQEIDTRKERAEVCKQIDKFLAADKSQYLRVCRRCGEELGFDNPYSLCEDCYSQTRFLYEDFSI